MHVNNSDHLPVLTLGKAQLTRIERLKNRGNHHISPWVCSVGRPHSGCPGPPQGAWLPLLGFLILWQEDAGQVHLPESHFPALKNGITMTSVRRKSPSHWFLFVSIRITPLAPSSSLTLSSPWDNEWLPWLPSLEMQQSKHDPEPSASSPWELPIYGLTYLLLCVHCVVKIQALTFKFKLNSCSTYFSNGGEKTKNIAIVILSNSLWFCFTVYKKNWI